jgi:hypothetical protein
MLFPTKPWHPFDIILWPTLRLLLEPVSVKQSHFWHWRRYHQEIDEGNLILVPGLANLPPASNCWQSFLATNFLWPKVAIFHLRGQFDPRSGYQIGYLDKKTNKRELCSIVIKKSRCACLVGQHNAYFFIIDQSTGRLIQPKEIDFSYRKSLPREIPLI